MRGPCLTCWPPSWKCTIPLLQNTAGSAFPWSTCIITRNEFSKNGGFARRTSCFTIHDREVVQPFSELSSIVRLSPHAVVCVGVLFVECHGLILQISHLFRRNILVNRPSEQSSRWSSENNYPPQVVYNSRLGGFSELCWFGENLVKRSRASLRFVVIELFKDYNKITDAMIVVARFMR